MCAPSLHALLLLSFPIVRASLGPYSLVVADCNVFEYKTEVIRVITGDYYIPPQQPMYLRQNWIFLESGKDKHGANQAQLVNSIKP